MNTRDPARKRILIVEDDELVARELSLRIAAMGYTIAGTVATGRAAVEAVTRQRPDLVLMDILLPGELDGIEAAGIILDRHHVPLLYLTAYADDALFDRARITAPHAYLLKPYNDRELQLAIELALQRHAQDLQVAKETAAAAEQQDRRIEELAALLTALIEGSTDCIFAKDLEGRYMLCNRAIEDLLGKRRDEMLGHRDEDLFPRQMAAHFRADDARFIASATTGSYEEQVLGSAGLRTFLTTKGALMIDGEVRGVFGIARDISERKEVELRLQTLSARLINVQEAERRRLAHDLHDDIGQNLTMIKIMLQGIARLSAGDMAVVRESGELADRTLQRVRALSVALRPPQLDDLGLVPALRAHLDSTCRQAGLEVSFAADELPGMLPDMTAIACFRIAQEALTNVIRHAGARSIKVEVRYANGVLKLCLRDDGCGFDVAAALTAAARGKSLGLLPMQEGGMRAGGRLEVVVRATGSEVCATFLLSGASP
ncbi:MAG: PAS domain-containing protein [Burkholderiaceae bacterium]|nr:PAS domain-containing protein [Burkholderiaceae bacterium]